LFAFGLSLIMLLATAGIAYAAGEPQPGGRFFDDDDSIFQNAIEAIATDGITQGCNPPYNTGFCPDELVTRGQMAVFLVRALDLTDDGGGNLFTDDNGLFYEKAADRLATAGITSGCNPPANDQFCGDANVTRGQMAAFIVRAMKYTDDGGGNLFTDDNDNIFESAIDKLGTAGVTAGCNPPANDEFCPDNNVTRGQMAAFLTRALGLPAPTVPNRPETTNGVNLAIGVVASDMGCDIDTDDFCVINQSPTGEFYQYSFWWQDEWSSLSSEEMSAFQSDQVTIRATLDGLDLDLFEWPFEVENDIAYKRYSFQFPAWLQGKHVIELTYVDDIEDRVLTIRDNLTTNGGGYTLTGGVPLSSASTSYPEAFWTTDLVSAP
jgi:hypothetical protein